VIVERLEQITPALRSEWDALQARARDATLFTSSTWVLRWWEAFGEGKALRILAVRDGAELVGVAPLLWSRVRRRPGLSMHHVHEEDRAFLGAGRGRGCVLPVRQLAVAGNLQSGNIRGGVVAGPGREEAVLRAVLAHLAADPAWDMVCLPGVPSGDVDRLAAAARNAGLRVCRIGRLNRLYGVMVRPWAEYVGARSKHFRKRVRAAEMKLRAMGGLETGIVVEPARLGGVLDEMFDLGRSSWKERGEKDPSVRLPVTESAVTFYRALALERAAAGGSVLVALRLDGRLGAALLGVREGDTLYLLQTFYAEELATGSPGRLLFSSMLGWAAAAGIKRIDANGNTPLVRLFCDESQDYDQVFVFRPSGYSGWLYRVARALEALRSRGVARRVPGDAHALEGRPGSQGASPAPPPGRRPVLAISSPGGHWIQLRRLCAGLEGRYAVVYAVPRRRFASALDGRVYSVPDVSATTKWRLVLCGLKALYILLRERPVAVVSTGAGPGAVAVWLAHLLGIRTIWVDSIANVRQISQAGELVKRHVDVFLTQWKHLSDDRHILFRGRVL